jgi:quinol---cytochrome c reductase iron-sulfur subunit, bacillus type
VWADAGEIAEFSQSVPQEITFESRQADGWNIEESKASAWIVRQGDGSMVSFSPWCTHLGCAYHWESKRSETGGCFVCPCHGSRFHANGIVLEGPASRPLDRYATKTQGSRLWILPGTTGEPS